MLTGNVCSLTQRFIDWTSVTEHADSGQHMMCSGMCNWTSPSVTSPPPQYHGSTPDGVSQIQQQAASAS